MTKYRKVPEDFSDELLSEIERLSSQREDEDGDGLPDGLNRLQFVVSVLNSPHTQLQAELEIGAFRYYKDCIVAFSEVLEMEYGWWWKAQKAHALSKNIHKYNKKLEAGVAPATVFGYSSAPDKRALADFFNLLVKESMARIAAD